ncbi:glucokinase [Bowmanella sp. Y26]|uniref:Glucokinase n=1 Tax=Bowmanella yangjiangensis TaxID=2811230 RepID=A0ABS3CW46_9ALTE|nr:glucokinase [Bowmanella yangjiangensis]MBN7821342.1 glucokinase [Bowmanella yangjiangensis]MBT1065248.1 glucokinase [Bowmanella yangjiangensis]
MTAQFVADVGGTNIRLAQVVDGQITQVKKYLCNDYATIADAIRAYTQNFPALKFAAGCIAIACPVDKDLIKMTNHNWQFSKSALKAELALDCLEVINDYTAIAMSLPVLTDEQKVQIGGGQAQAGQNIAVFGPGTGLGVGHLTAIESGWQCLDGEGGHVDFAPIDELDLVIWRFLNKKHGHASAEEILSGRGLVQVYQALAEHAGQNAELSEPADITQKALSGECQLCLATLQQFCRVMGSFGGNLALNLATFGGVYIAGGIVPRFVDFLRDSEFRQRFEAKGRFKDYVAAIPTFVITEPDHGLIGTAAYLTQHFKG